MKILLGGGTGLLGKALVETLVSAGHTCAVLSRSPERHTASSERVSLHAWDAQSSEPLLDLMDEVDAVIQLSGESIGGGRWTKTQKQRILDSRVVSTRALVRAAQEVDTSPSVFIQASAVGYYGPCGDEEVTEDSPAGSDYLADVCLQWESASAELDQVGIRRAVIRTGVVLSSLGGALPRMALPFKLFAGGPAGSGRQWMPWIHLADEVAAIRFLLEHPEGRGVFNLATPNPATNRDFSRALGRALKRPSLLPAPAFALRLALGEMADLILTGQRAIPRNLQRLGFTFQFTELPAALNDIF